MPDQKCVLFSRPRVKPKEIGVTNFIQWPRQSKRICFQLRSANHSVNRVQDFRKEYAHKMRDRNINCTHHQIASVAVKPREHNAFAVAFTSFPL